jgi:hypothetical protein
MSAPLFANLEKRRSNFSSVATESTIIEFDSDFQSLNRSGNSWAKSAIECVDWTT